MKRILPVLLLASLAACSTTVETGGKDMVSIRFNNNYSNSGTTLQPLADAECAKSGRKARYAGTTLGKGFIGFLTNLPLHAHYDCVKRS